MAPSRAIITALQFRTPILRTTSTRIFSQIHQRLQSTRLEPPAELDDAERDIFNKLVDGLAPVSALEVHDISGGCGQMYNVNITSEKFKGLPMIKQHKLVNSIIGEEIKKWHGIQLKTTAPS